VANGCSPVVDERLAELAPPAGGAVSDGIFLCGHQGLTDERGDLLKVPEIVDIRSGSTVG
jgi:hypothetical protein